MCGIVRSIYIIDDMMFCLNHFHVESKIPKHISRRNAMAVICALTDIFCEVIINTKKACHFSSKMPTCIVRRMQVHIAAYFLS